MNLDIKLEEYNDEELAILKFQIDKGIEIIKAKRENKPLDVSEQIEFISNVLGISLPDLIKSMVVEMNEPEVKEHDSDQEVLDFLESCDSDVKDYEEKLKALQELKDL